MNNPEKAFCRTIRRGAQFPAWRGDCAGIHGREPALQGMPRRVGEVMSRAACIHAALLMTSLESWKFESASCRGCRTGRLPRSGLPTVSAAPMSGGIDGRFAASSTCRQPAANLPPTCRQPAANLPLTCRQPAAVGCVINLPQ